MNLPARSLAGAAPRPRRRVAALGPPRVAVPVFLGYTGVAMARLAMERAAALLRATCRHAELQPMLWRADQLVAPRWRETALREAARASAVVLAAGSAAEFDTALLPWLERFVGSHAGLPRTVLVLLEDDEWTVTLGAPPPLALPASRPAPPPAVGLDLGPAAVAA